MLKRTLIVPWFCVITFSVNILVVPIHLCAGDVGLSGDVETILNRVGFCVITSFFF